MTITIDQPLQQKPLSFDEFLDRYGLSRITSDPRLLEEVGDLDPRQSIRKV
jgi:hypothetical protein